MMKYLCTVSCVLDKRYKRGHYYEFEKNPNKGFSGPRFKKVVGDSQENGNSIPEAQSIRDSVPKDGLNMTPADLEKMNRSDLIEKARKEGLDVNTRMQKQEVLNLFK